MQDDKKEIQTEAEEVEFVDEDGEGNTKDPVKRLRERLEATVKEKQEYLNNWQRERADFQNYKKEEMTRLARTKEVATERFVEDLLPVLDAYDMAFSNKEAWEKVDKNWRIGVEYIHAQLLKVLGDYGVVPIAVKDGDTFDANLHESIESVETEDGDKDHTVAQIIQSGYKIGERVLRPARVKVWSHK